MEVALGVAVDARRVTAARADGWEVVLATGSRPFPDRYPGATDPPVVDALALFADGTAGLPDGPVVVDDPVGDAVGVGVAEWLAAATDRQVTLVSPDPVAGTLLARTGDLADANVRLQRAGVARRLRSRITAAGDGQVAGVDVWTGEPFSLPAASWSTAATACPTTSCTWPSATRASGEPATASPPAPSTRPSWKAGGRPWPSSAADAPPLARGRAPT